MVFAADAAPQAYDEIEDLMTKGRKGFGISCVDRSAVEGFQCSLIESFEIEEYTHSISVPVVHRTVRPEEADEEPSWDDYASADEPADGLSEAAVEEPSWATASSL